MDVTRKVINLARECGNKIELSAVDTGQCVCRRIRLSSRTLHSTFAGAVHCPAAKVPGVAPAAPAHGCCSGCCQRLLCSLPRMRCRVIGTGAAQELALAPGVHGLAAPGGMLLCCDCKWVCHEGQPQRGLLMRAELQIVHRVGHGFVGGDAAAHFTRAC